MNRTYDNLSRIVQIKQLIAKYRAGKLDDSDVFFTSDLVAAIEAICESKSKAACTKALKKIFEK